MASAVVKNVEIGDEVYTLTAKFGTMRAAETELGTSIPKLMVDPENVGFDAMSALFWAFLQPQHRMTREGSDALVDIVGFEQVTKWVGEALSQYFKTSKTEVETTADEGNVKPVAKKKVGKAS